MLSDRVELEKVIELAWLQTSSERELSRVMDEVVLSEVMEEVEGGGGGDGGAGAGLGGGGVGAGLGGGGGVGDEANPPYPAGREQPLVFTLRRLWTSNADWPGISFTPATIAP